MQLKKSVIYVATFVTKKKKKKKKEERDDTFLTIKFSCIFFRKYWGFVFVYFIHLF